jgi:hypothetical protein
MRSAILVLSGFILAFVLNNFITVDLWVELLIVAIIAGAIILVEKHISRKSEQKSE